LAGLSDLKGVRSLKRKTAQGFTLIELLVVIAIIAILAVVLILVLNPAETNARARDSKRLTDLQTLQSAITIVGQEVAGLVQCVGIAQGTACRGDSTQASNGTLVNGTGWVKIDLTQVAPNSGSIVQIASLPVDPVNTTGATGYRYVYCSTNTATPTWEVFTRLEAGSNATKMANDGGASGSYYEIGTNLTLAGVGTCTY
jgi:prepilin-type N-terminal cleavage/methylation domain-containing protein